jgi:hypothetical protein
MERRDVWAASSGQRIRAQAEQPSGGNCGSLAAVEIARFEVDRHGGNESGLLQPPCVGVAERCRGLCIIHHNG